MLAVASALAADMLSASPEILVAMKRLIDDGAATTLNRGLEMERERSRAWSKTLDPAAIEAGRESVVSRGAQGALNLSPKLARALSSALSAAASSEARR